MTDMLIPTAAALVDAAALRPGLLVVPSDERYDEVRTAWTLAVDQRPAAVAVPESAEDVVAVVRYAGERGLRVSAQATGHNAGPLGDLSDVVLVKTHLMRGVQIDADRQVARAEAGALWMDVVEPAAAVGLAALHGSAPDVGVVGYSLGGGVSWFSPRYGLASSRVLAVEIVTADGEHVRADRRQNTDLFWAVRGGGGGFGIVTHIEFELLEIGAIQSGGLWFPVERAREVLQAWRTWAPALPDHVSTSARILNVPPIPEAPEALRGKSFALVLVSVLGDPAEADRHLAGLRAMGPMMDTVHPTALTEMTELAMDPPSPVPAVGAHAIFDELTEEAVDAIVDASTAAGTLVVSYLTLGGGASGRRSCDGAVTSMDAPFLFFGAALALPHIAEIAAAEMRGVEEALAPHASGRAYLNFAERRTDPAALFGEETLGRLRAIKATRDPEGRIVGNHTV